jgi:hypothetical protein
MTDIEILNLREEYETSKMKMIQFADDKGMDYEKTRYALRKGLKLRRQSSGDVTFTPIQTDHLSKSEKISSTQNIIITTSNGTIIQIPS